MKMTGGCYQQRDPAEQEKMTTGHRWVCRSVSGGERKDKKGGWERGERAGRRGTGREGGERVWMSMDVTEQGQRGQWIDD